MPINLGRECSVLYKIPPIGLQKEVFIRSLNKKAAFEFVKVAWVYIKTSLLCEVALIVYIGTSLTFAERLKFWICFDSFGKINDSLLRHGFGDDYRIDSNTLPSQ